jgi:hypothetical protein
MPRAGYRKTKCHGVRAPERLYTKEGCMKAAGIGRKTLLEAKRSGIVKAIPAGERVYFRGSELIAWIESYSESK